jgi:hypothetical protein
MSYANIVINTQTSVKRVIGVLILQVNVFTSLAVLYLMKTIFQPK